MLLEKKNKHWTPVNCRVNHYAQEDGVYVTKPIIHFWIIITLWTKGGCWFFLCFLPTKLRHFHFSQFNQTKRNKRVARLKIVLVLRQLKYVHKLQFCEQEWHCHLNLSHRCLTIFSHHVNIADVRLTHTHTHSVTLIRKPASLFENDEHIF